MLSPIISQVHLAFSGLNKHTGKMVPTFQSIFLAEPDRVNADVELGTH